MIYNLYDDEVARFDLYVTVLSFFMGELRHGKLEYTYFCWYVEYFDNQEIFIQLILE